MKLEMPVLNKGQVPFKIYTIPDIELAANTSAGTIFTLPVPFSDLAFVEAMVKAKDSTDFALYHIEQAVRNDTSKFVKASQTLTVASANFSNGETVTIGSKVYTFQTTLTNVDGNVLVGATATASLLNLKNAINLGTGAGTTYATAMTAQGSVTAISSDATTLVIEAITPGTAANSIATTETCSTVSWGAATMAGGVDAIALVGSNVLDAFESDNTWTAAIAANAPSGIKITGTSDGTNATTFSGWVKVYLA